MQLLDSSIKDEVLREVGKQLENCREEIIRANQADLEHWNLEDPAMYDRLKINSQKIDEMISAVIKILQDEDPVGKLLYSFKHANGIKIENRSAPFGTILIIYESRPDVTIEAASVAFKSNNKILLKGGKEALNSNKALVSCWHSALDKFNLAQDWIQLLELDRSQTQEFLKSPSVKIDLIVPRGGEGLINFVKAHASCPVLVSGRGNNFMYVHDDANWSKVIPIVVNAKTDKISACNALDKLLIHRNTPDLSQKLEELIDALKKREVEIIVDRNFPLGDNSQNLQIDELKKLWEEEFLALKIVIDLVDNSKEAIDLINKHSGGHSVSVLTENSELAKVMMDTIDAAAVYHNASTRFTDGGQFGLGAELAISTDKIHHRGPLGLQQLVTNKWYIFGEGQIR